MAKCAECKATLWTGRTSLEKCLIVSLILTGAFALAVSSAYLAAVLISQHKNDTMIELMMKSSDSECKTRSCIYSAETILENMDPTISPCDDFHKFACGNFLKKVLPAGKERVTVLTLLGEKVKEQMKNMLEEPLQKKEPKAFQLMKKFYKICMDTDAIEKNGLNTIQSFLKDLGGWPLLEGDNWTENKFDWKELSYKFQKMGFLKNPLFQVYVQTDLRNPSRRALFLTDEEGAAQQRFHESQSEDTLQAYYQYIEDVAVLLGADKIKARKEINETYNLYAKLWSFSANKSENNVPEELSIKQLQQKFPNIVWVDYINNLLAPHIKITDDDTVYVMHQTYFKNLDSLFPDFANKKRVLANYMIWKFIHFAIPYSTKALRDALLKYTEVYPGVASQNARWVDCVQNFMTVRSDGGVESESLYIGAGAMFVRKYFNKTIKKDTHEMISNIHHSLQDSINKVEWMDPQTKQEALDKLKAMNINTAYPDELLDDKKLEGFYGSLTLDENDYLKTILKLNLFDAPNYYKEFRKPVERNHWVARAMVNMVNVSYFPDHNIINIPAAMLQDFYFDSNRPQYLNYGALGITIGHEMTHGFDSVGSKYDKNGNKHDWWSSTSRKSFSQKAQCFVEQYNKYVLPDLKLTVNGTITLSENIADNSGIAVSYKAYQDWVKKYGADQTLPGLNYTQNQLFWIAVGNSWCSKSTVHFQKIILDYDVHSPKQFRIIGSLSNSKDFSKDFSCSSKSKMNPKNKCTLW